MSQLDERQIRLPVLGREARDHVAEVGAVERRVSSSILPVRNPLPSGLNGTKPMPSSSSAGSTSVFGLSPPERVLALQRRDRLDGMRAANGLHAGLRQAEVPDLPFLNQVLHGSGDVFDRDVRVDAVLVEEVDPSIVEPLERRLGDLSDVRGPAVQAGLLAALELEPELRGDDHLIANRCQRLADELLRW